MFNYPDCNCGHSNYEHEPTFLDAICIWRNNNSGPCCNCSCVKYAKQQKVGSVE